MKSLKKILVEIEIYRLKTFPSKYCFFHSIGSLLRTFCVAERQIFNNFCVIMVNFDEIVLQPGRVKLNKNQKIQ